MANNGKGNGGGGGDLAESKKAQRQQAAALKKAANQARNRANAAKKEQARTRKLLEEETRQHEDLYRIIILTPEETIHGVATEEELLQLEKEISEANFEDRPEMFLAYRQKSKWNEAKVSFSRGLRLPYRIRAEREGFVLVQAIRKDNVVIGYDRIRDLEMGELPEEIRSHYLEALGHWLQRRQQTAA